MKHTPYPRSVGAHFALSAAITWLGAATLLTSVANAQQGPLAPWVGERGITETVAQIMARERARPPQRVTRADVELLDPSSGPPCASFAMFAGASSASTGGAAPTTDVPHGSGQQAPLAAPQAVGTSFHVDDQNNMAPGDPTMGVGPTQILAATSEVIKVFDKNGTLGALNVSIETFFASVGTNCDRMHVRYDKTSGRWFVATVDVGTIPSPNKLLIAVSSGATITDSSSFTFYSFQQDLVAPIGDVGSWASNPKLAVDAHALYLGALIVSGSTYVGTSAWIVRKSSILSGGPIVVTAVRNLAGGTGTPGMEAPLGVDNDDPLETDGYLVAVSQDTQGLLLLRRVTDPGGTPAISAEIPVVVPATTNASSQPHLGGANVIVFSSTAMYGDRLFSAMIHRDRLTGIPSLWTSHHIEVNTSGVADVNGDKNGARWYQLDDLASAPVLTQSGTLFDSIPGIRRGYYFPSVAASGQGHMAMVTSFSSTGERIGIAAAGRLASDPLGATQAPTTAIAGQSYWNNSSHWGSYSNVAVDPTDDQTMWAVGQYTFDDNDWGVRVIKLIAPPPATPASASPANVLEGSSNVQVVVTGTSTAGSGFYDTEPGVNRLVAEVLGGGVTVNSVTWTSPTSITLDLSLGSGIAVGTRVIRVTNPDGQVRASLAGILTVDSTSCLAFPEPPTDQQACVGSSATFTVTVSGGTALSYQWRKDGVDIGGANASSYTIPSTVLADAGAYDVVVSDPCGTAASAAATLTVPVACVPGPAFCFGDGSLATPCPCVPPNTIPNPSGAPGHGCANSFDLNGALLIAVGTLSPDAVQFTSDIGPTYQGFGFLFKGNATVASGVAVSDGIRCVSGALIRFGGHNAGSNGDPIGKWRYPNGVQTTPVSVATAQPSGQVAYYQHYYRNATASFCTSATANLSNGVAIAWP
ncbi:MAG: hypothetical protein ACKVWV_16010 [Planctomycetota bacterium]